MHHDARTEHRSHFLICRTGQYRFGFLLEEVEEIVRSVAILPVPESPSFILGVINVRGRLIPLLDLRRKLGLAPRDIELTDRIVITRAGSRLVALCVDAVDELEEISEESFASPDMLGPGPASLHGVANTSSGLLLIPDFSVFLTQWEEQSLIDLEAAGAFDRSGEGEG